MGISEEMVELFGIHKEIEEESARLIVHKNEVIGSHLVPGLDMKVDETENGISAHMVVREGVKISKPVHLCFGIIPEDGIQMIDMDVELEDRAAIEIIAHCTFPNAVNIEHLMNADIRIGKGASYKYHETHFHGFTGGIKIVPKARITMEEDSILQTTFALPKGRAGKIDIDYEADIGARATLYMIAKIAGSADDNIKIREAGTLSGEGSRGVLETRIALTGSAQAEVINELNALAPNSIGHVDCQEIVQDKAKARAIPVVDVRDASAKVTHEAAIGSIDNNLIETLMSRGLDEEEATELIISGLLSGG